MLFWNILTFNTENQRIWYFQRCTITLGEMRSTAVPVFWMCRTVSSRLATYKCLTASTSWQTWRSGQLIRVPRSPTETAEDHLTLILCWQSIKHRICHTVKSRAGLWWFWDLKGKFNFLSKTHDCWYDFCFACNSRCNKWNFDTLIFNVLDFGIIYQNVLTFCRSVT